MLRCRLNERGNGERPRAFAIRCGSPLTFGFYHLTEVLLLHLRGQFWMVLRRNHRKRDGRLHPVQFQGKLVSRLHHLAGNTQRNPLFDRLIASVVDGLLSP